MAETETETQGDLEDRVGNLEDGQSKIMAKLDQIIGGGHARAEAHTERRLDRPSTVEEQVRMELDRKDKEAAAKAKEEKQAADHQTLAERLAKLEEAPPIQPQPRRQRIMWGDR